MEEYRASTPRVAGSIPVRESIYFILFYIGVIYMSNTQVPVKKDKDLIDPYDEDLMASYEDDKEDVTKSLWETEYEEYLESLNDKGEKTNDRIG